MSFYPCHGGIKATEQFAELMCTLKNNQIVRNLLGTPQGDVFDILNYNFGWSSDPGTATVKFNLKNNHILNFLLIQRTDQ